jgi:hypothetical protein
VGDALQSDFPPDALLQDGLPITRNKLRAGEIAHAPAPFGRTRIKGKITKAGFLETQNYMYTISYVGGMWVSLGWTSKKSLVTQQPS